MKVHDFQAEPAARGGQIDLSWVNPSATDFPAFRRIRIFRRTGTEPSLVLDDDSNLVAQSPAVELNLPLDPELHGQARQFTDVGLQNNTIYYYLIVALGPDPQTALPVGVTASALALTPWQTADELYRRLPALYQRYDNILPPAIPGLEAGLVQKGQLRRLIEMFGLQFDLLRSYADGMQDFADRERIDGALLPLLAEWIGWPLNHSLPLATQRNEIRHAPPNYRTTGTAANLLATFNRLTVTEWNPEIREFAHNVFLSNAPEQLTIRELKQNGANWESAGAVTLDVAYEGRPVIVRSTDAADERLWLFYHARQMSNAASGATPQTQPQWQLWLKVFEQGQWGPSRRLTFNGQINKYPTAAVRAGGGFWVIWSSHEGRQFLPRLRMQAVATGRAALPPQLRSQPAAPLNFAAGAPFTITINTGAQTFTRTVRMQPEHFQNLADVQPEELAALLDRELPGVNVTAEGRSLVITAQTAGAAATLTLPAPLSPVATQLNFISRLGRNAAPARLQGLRAENFNLAAGDKLTVIVDGGLPREIEFQAAQFANINAATAREVVNAINQNIPGAARVAVIGGANVVELQSPTSGGQAQIVLDIDRSSAAPKLGLGAPLPANSSSLEDTEPTALFEAGRLWLFWSSRRTGRWQLWYNLFDTVNWRPAPRQLTTGGEADREPAAVLDNRPAPDRRMWVFWSRKNNDGRWNIFFRSTTKFDFATLADADWTGPEASPTQLDPVVESYDRREPWPVMTSSGAIDLYFSANRADGWQVWSKRVPSAAGVVEQPVTTGRFTHRAPTALVTIDRITRIWLRSNESVLYESPSYPAAKTLDLQYTGSTTADTRNAAKLSNIAKPDQPAKRDDVQRYSYDTGRLEKDLYARDTVGIFYQPPLRMLEEELKPRLRYIENALARVLPIQMRVVLIRKA